MKKFEIGTKYRVDGVQWVCVDRYTNDKGETIVGFVELAQFRQDLKDEFFTPLSIPNLVDFLPFPDR